MSSLYKQAPLPREAMHIRLLELEPSDVIPITSDDHGKHLNIGNEDYSKPLRCRIFSSPIDGACFEALSYAWGSGQKTHKLWATTSGSDTATEREFCALSITESLDEALRHARHPSKSLTLWIDQICIDQSNTDEKTRQVALMTQIYMQASSVLVWLGPGTPLSDRLMDIFSEVGQEARDWGIESYYTPERFPLLRQIEGKAAPQELADLSMSFKDLCRRTALRFLGKTNADDPDDLTIFQSIAEWYRRSWFSRVWVMQEFALSRHPIFVYGKKRTEARLVLLAKQILEKSTTIAHIFYRDGESMQVPAPSSLVEAFDQTYYDTTQSFFTAASRRRKLNGGDGPGDTLYQLLVRMYGNRTEQVFMAVDPRDRIYGLLGLSIDTKSLGIIPDYSESVTADLVYTNVTRAIVGQQSKEPGDEYALDILSLARFPKRGPTGVVESFPSWVPDWSRLQQSFCARIHSTLMQPAFFTASGDNKQARMMATTSQNLLGLEGFCVDEVVEVGTPWFGAHSSDWAAHLEMLREVERMCRIAADTLASTTQSTSGDTQKLDEAVWRVPIGDIEDVDNKWQRATTRSRIAHSYIFEKSGPSGLLRPDEHDNEEFIASFSGGEHNRYAMRMAEMRNMRPFITKERGLVGMGPHITEPGDIVVIFHGAQVPYIVRRQDQPKTYSFLGEAYCHGMMDGEVLLHDKTSEPFYLI